jgi:hypothetical protein
MLRKGDIRVCPETNAELLIRWSEVRVLPPQPISFQRLSGDQQGETRPKSNLLYKRIAQFSASMNPTLKFAMLLAALTVSTLKGDQPDGSRLIAQSDTGRVLYRMIACDDVTLSATDCHAREQQRLDRRLREQWVRAAAKGMPSR